MAMACDRLDAVKESESLLGIMVGENDSLGDELLDEEMIDPTGGDLAIGDREIEERYQRWRPLYDLRDEIQEEQLRHLVIESIRIRRCVSHESASRQILVDRARECWDLDREAAACDLINKLHRNPYRWRKELLRTVAGCQWMIDEWRSLLAALDQQAEGWDERQRSRALDLLGVSTLFRGGSTPLDLPADALRQRIVDEVDQLIAIRDEQLEPAERSERDLAASGQLMATDRISMAMRRFEAGCRRRFNELTRALEPFRIDPPQPNKSRKPSATAKSAAQNESVAALRSILEISKQRAAQQNETERRSGNPLEACGSSLLDPAALAGIDGNLDRAFGARRNAIPPLLTATAAVSPVTEESPRDNKAAALRRERRKAAAKARKRNRR